MKRKKITINQIIYSIKGSLIINKLINAIDATIIIIKISINPIDGDSFLRIASSKLVSMLFCFIFIFNYYDIIQHNGKYIKILKNVSFF